MTEPLLRLRAHALDWRVIDDEVVMLDAERSAYMATNPSGTLLWEALRDGATASALADVLVDAYGIEHTQARSDVEAFLADLRARDLLEDG